MRKHLRYLIRYWRSRQDYDDPTWPLVAGLAFWLLLLWFLCFF
ncbi:hypothetical protein [Goodfellowiella coeruleoviolacea]|uniref:Uncharacterized protein n=1 Tax=Goodfellowiella coeruleoviolacea TaxID=334858 RepID=A0AAE3GH55_9PSEU|nr:hypothetical protein [Goodfellowiella coeruleoviolacea]MCP2168146.1 hypothetical protein [Goodfellowiella coeruleoviolacea]